MTKCYTNPRLLYFTLLIFTVHMIIVIIKRVGVIRLLAQASAASVHQQCTKEPAATAQDAVSQQHRTQSNLSSSRSVWLFCQVFFELLIFVWLQFANFYCFLSF